MSSSAGSLVLASFCAARRMYFCLFIASSRARIDFCRPTKSGTTMCGKTMMSRSGRSGTRSPPACGGASRASRFSFRKSIRPPFRYAVSAAFWKRMMGCSLLVTTSSEMRTSLMFGCDGMSYITSSMMFSMMARIARDRREGAVGEAEVHAFHLEELLVLPGEGVLRFLQDADQRRLVELLKGGDDREPAHEFGDQPELEQVLGLHLVQEVAHAALVLTPYIGAEAHSLDPDAPADDVVEPDEGPPADEKDVGGVDLQELLLGVLAAALGRDAGGGALDDLEQRLLHALARHVAGDRGVVALACDLVDLVDVDDAPLALLDVVVGVLEEREDDVLDVLADVAGLGQAGGVGDRERHLQEAGERLREERLAAARRPDEQDVRLLQLDVARDQLRVDALVVVVDRDRQDLLGALLADHVLVEDLLDLGRLRHRRGGRESLLLVDLLGDDVVAEVDALVADVDDRAGDQLADLVLALATERADEVAGAVVTVLRHEASPTPS